MAIKPTLSNIFNPLRNPSQSGIVPQNFTPTAGGVVSPALFSSATRTLPVTGQTYQSPVLAQPTAPVAPASPVQTTVPAAPMRQAPGAPAAPMNAAPAGLDYSRYTDPSTGKVMSPQEYASFLAARVTGGSVPNYAGNSLTQGPQTAAQLTSTATDLNNQRNDIAVGATDPYKAGSKSGVAYSPSELAAIEKAYAGIYDPALKDVFAKLDAKTKEDAAAADLKNQLALQAQKHKDDIALKMTAAPGSGVNSNQMTDNERAAQTLFQGNQIVKDYNTVINQKNTIDNLIQNGVGGPADVASIFTFMKALDPNSVVRESEYDKAAASGNLFKGAWTKFNGYFKDNGGFLPDNVRNEFQNLINQKLSAQGASYKNLASQTKEIAKRQGMNPDNVVIDFSGAILGNSGSNNVLRSPDGTQEVTVSELTPAELQEAQAAGWK